MFDVPLIINGEHVHTPSEMQFNVIHSESGKTAWTASGADVELTKKAIESSAAAFQSWRKTTVSERRALFQKALELIRQREDEIIKIMMGETSCSEAWAKMNMIMGTGAMEEISGRASMAFEGTIPASENNGMFSQCLASDLLCVAQTCTNNILFCVKSIYTT